MMLLQLLTFSFAQKLCLTSCYALQPEVNAVREVQRRSCSLWNHFSCCAPVAGKLFALLKFSALLSIIATLQHACLSDAA